MRSIHDETLGDHTPQASERGTDETPLPRARVRDVDALPELARPESYLHEASFVQNPLGGRLPSTTPRKLARPRAYDLVGDVPTDERPADAAPATPSKDIPLQSVDTQLQDVLILEDLLYVLVGIEGNYIQFAPGYKPDDLGHRLNGATFTIDADLDRSLRDLTERILPLASYYTSIYAFVERDSGLEYGTVMHALCAAIRQQLNAYEDLVADMEQRMLSSPDFTLQQLWLALHPTLRTFGLIHSLTSEIASITHADVLPRAEAEEEESDESLDYDSDASQLERDRRALLGLDDALDEDIEGGVVKGGEVLSMLWDRLTRLGGAPDAHALFLELFREASQPYARILLRWITSGQLLDPYEEFMIVEDARVTQASLESDPTDEYWERRYMLRDERIFALKEQEQRDAPAPAPEDDQARGELTGGAKIPSFLEPWKYKILSAGKYLNTIRECGIDVSDTNSPRVLALFGHQDAHVDTYLKKEAHHERVVMDDEAYVDLLTQIYDGCRECIPACERRAVAATGERQGDCAAPCVGEALLFLFADRFPAGVPRPDRARAAQDGGSPADPRDDAPPPAVAARLGAGQLGYGGLLRPL